MTNHLSLVFSAQHKQTTISTGLAPIVCYEPWFPRFLESVKHSINDGYPVLVRLHSAASYPIDSETRYLNDLESHAVLIVGYDDAKQAVALIDPWDNTWGGSQGGRRWMPYAVLSTINVDSSTGMSICLAPLIVKPEFHWDSAANLSIKLDMGFYTPKGTVMDLESWKLTEVNVLCILPDDWGSKRISHTVHGNWVVGDGIHVSFPIVNSPKCNGEIKLLVRASVKGKRPYDFTDVLEINEILPVKLPLSAMKHEQEQFVCASAL